MRLTITYVPGTVKKGSVRKVSQKSQMKTVQEYCRLAVSRIKVVY